MNRQLVGWLVGAGCLVIILIMAGFGVLFYLVAQPHPVVVEEASPMTRPTLASAVIETQGAIPTATIARRPTLAPTQALRQEVTREVKRFTRPAQPALVSPAVDSATLTALYERVNPGVVNIQVVVQREGRVVGQGSGSGFILDKAGHIVTNNHVVAGASDITVVFYDSFQVKAEIVGTDDDSDLAVIKVARLPDGTYPLPLGDSDKAKPGEWVVAIGSPFGLGSSITMGIVSAVGRTIASGVTPFSIPQAIQTDAAINPGNSGGPLLNLQGEVIGVNAQIASSGSRANAGVGFAIPANIVRRVAPVLIESGAYHWPWIGVTGRDVNLAIMEANDLDTQKGAFISSVVPGGPADKAGLVGASESVMIDGAQIPVGGDVIIEADGKSVEDFSDLLIDVAFKLPGDEIKLTIIRDGKRRQIAVKLDARPDEFDQ